MTNDQPQIADRPIRLLLIDDEPIFRLGFGAAIAQYSDLQAIAVDTAAAALEYLSEQLPDLIILEPNLGQSSETGLQLAQQIKSEYPNVPIFLLSANPTPQQLNTAQSLGIRGYCPKGIAISELVSALREVASGETYWQALALPASQVSTPPRRQKWLTRIHQSGLQQIDDSLARVERSLRNPQLPLFDWLFWSGRKRELLTARWLVNQLPVEVITPEPPARENALVPLTSSTLPIIVPQPEGATAVFENTLTKIQSGVKNLTGVPFEIDILRTQKRQELLYDVLNKVNEVLDELRFLQVTPEQLPDRMPLILRDLWQSSTIDFLIRNYTISVETNRFSLVEILMSNIDIVQKDILEKIPFATELFNYLLFEKPLLIDTVVYRLDAPEALERAEILIQNLIVQGANGVMQVVLNNFHAVEEIKSNLYGSQYLSAREMARFRNNLSWKYRQEKYWEDPKNIFESQYRLFYLNGQGIKKVLIYASRQDELTQLRGIPWAVTIALEARDAIAPRLQAVVDFVGRGVVYILTEVIGKGIGLIGRGVILGIGNVLQETRYRKNSERGKQ